VFRGRSLHRSPCLVLGERESGAQSSLVEGRNRQSRAKGRESSKISRLGEKSFGDRRTGGAIPAYYSIRKGKDNVSKKVIMNRANSSRPRGNTCPSDHSAAAHLSPNSSSVLHHTLKVLAVAPLGRLHRTKIPAEESLRTVVDLKNNLVMKKI